MPSTFWSELIDPADFFPARYHRNPNAPPYPPPPASPRPKPELKVLIDAAARQVHALHFELWNDFTGQLRTILTPYPELFKTVAGMIDSTNCIFLKPLQEIGWVVPPK